MVEAESEPMTKHEKDYGQRLCTWVDEAIDPNPGGGIPMRYRNLNFTKGFKNKIYVLGSAK